MKKVDIEKLTLNELVEITGKARQEISGWVKRGCPQNKDKTFDLKAVIQWAGDQYRSTLQEPQACNLQHKLTLDILSAAFQGREQRLLTFCLLPVVFEDKNFCRPQSCSFLI